MSTLDYNTPDSLGKTPDLGLIGHQFTHPSSPDVYTVLTFVWSNPDDVWQAVYMGRNSHVTFTRPLDNFHARMQPYE